MAKRLLPLLNKEKDLWCRLYGSKYGEIHPWMKREVRKGIYQFKEIRKGLKALRGGILKQIGNGTETKIWNDPWITVIPLKHWPTYINIKELEKYSTVSQLLINNEWRNEVIEKCFDSILTERIQCIHTDICLRGDRWIWTESRNGELSIKGVYLHLKQAGIRAENINFNWNSIWRLKIAERVKYFCRKLVWDRLPLSDWFSKFSGIEIEDCVICGKEKESSEHILFKCMYAENYWRLVEQKLGIKFKKRDNWTKGNWILEAEGYEEASAGWLKAFLANSLWLI
ncbi:hypothetical protein Cni_G01898 [Canna indica]|uniref:Reverse transcriptase zinc-binding domain-containing protein n=1 Tax=Canna indica TaxID=4628 RepID=A0AAQ3Q1P2_9LILI|nr:hypothetical protein Cni_G01898 [Canna indica]